MFRLEPSLEMKRLEAIFRHKVFKMLLAKGRITQDLIAMLSHWWHSEFQVYCGQRIFPQDETAMENLARYIIRASFSQERMQYLPEPSKVVYRAKDGTKEKVFDALEWLAAMCSHILDIGGTDGPIPKILVSIRANSSNGNPHSNFKLTVVYL